MHILRYFHVISAVPEPTAETIGQCKALCQVQPLCLAYEYNLLETNQANCYFIFDLLDDVETVEAPGYYRFELSSCNGIKYMSICLPVYQVWCFKAGFMVCDLFWFLIL